MSKPKHTLEQLAEFYDVCRNTAQFLDPEKRAQALKDWASKQPENVQQLIKDGLPVLANIGKRIAERRVPRL